MAENSTRDDLEWPPVLADPDGDAIRQLRAERARLLADLGRASRELRSWKQFAALVSALLVIVLWIELLLWLEVL